MRTIRQIIRRILEFLGIRRKRAMNWRRWFKLLTKVIKQIRIHYKPDILVPAMNGGLVPVGAIAAALDLRDVRPVSIGREGEERFFLYPKGGDIGDISGTKILIVEDDVPTGRSVKFATAHFLAKGAKEVRVACVFKGRGIEGVEFYAKEVDSFPIYPWKETNLGDRR